MSNLVVESGEEQVFKSLSDLKGSFSNTRLEKFELRGTSKFSQNAQGNLVLEYANTSRIFSETGFDRFCKLVKAPPKFVKELPYDNIVKDLTASILKSETENLSLLVKDDIIIGASQKESPAHPTEIIDCLSSVQNTEFKLISKLEDSIVLNFTNSKEVLKNTEMFDVGLNMRFDFSNISYPVLSFYFMRLACMNGAIATDVVGVVSKVSGKTEKSKALEVLAERLRANRDNTALILKEAIYKMEQSKIEELDRKHLRRYLAKSFGWEEDNEGWANYEKTISSNASYFDLMNFITDHAKAYDTRLRTKYETIGGSMIGHFRSLRPTHEVLPGYTEFKRVSIYNEAHNN